MFSGIVEERATVVSFSAGAQHGTLVVQSALDLSDTLPGASIAVDGVCLTVTAKDGQRVCFDAGSETLRRSTLGSVRPGQEVNFERALKLGSRIDGHLVSGHVDATAALLARVDQGETVRMEWSLPEGLERHIAPKGSICLAGVSLTVGEVERTKFSVYVIPHSLALTTLDRARPGWKANLEVDLLSRYVVQALGASQKEDGEWEALLARTGFLRA